MHDRVERLYHDLAALIELISIPPGQPIVGGNDLVEVAIPTAVLGLDG